MAASNNQIVEHSGAVLSKARILEALANGDIVITPPVEPKHIGCASVDLSLGYEFRFFKNGPAQTVRVTDDIDYRDITDKVVLKEGETYVLLPGTACLGITAERVKLAPHLCGLLEGRTRFARLGLFVHISCGFMQSGIDSQQVLEIFNVSAHPLELVPGTRICQFVFMKMDGDAQYQGKFFQNSL